MKSVHVRRLESRVARTAARFVDQAALTGSGVADLPGLKLPWYAIRNQAADGTPEADTATVLIFDEIGGSFGVNAEDFARDLEAITAPTINVRINSPGGSLFDAIAMYNALNHHPARIVAYVDSLAASAASVIAMAGDEVVMMPGSQMMIHDASAVMDGNSAEMAKMATFLNRQSDNAAGLYQLRAGGDVADWRERMLAETWLFAGEAVELGLADRVEEPPAAAGDPEVDQLMTRGFDLSQFRYAGRRSAPAPVMRRRAGTARTHHRDRGKDGQMNATTASRAVRKAAAERKEAYAGTGRRVGGASAPAGAGRSLPFAAKDLRAQLVDRDGKQFYRVDGYASVFDRGYEMWDEFGPYMEVVDKAAFDRSLAAEPDVAFLVNHKGVTMARTTNGTLQLKADSVGLRTTAFLNPDRQDVRDLVSAISDRLIDEMSFAFLLDDGVWNDDFDEFRLLEVDINRGDTSAVNYGASPHTSIAARAREVLADINHLPAGAQRAALRQLEERLQVVVVETGDGDGEDGGGGDDVACLSCGALNEDDAKFCDQCGKPMPATDENSGDAPAGPPQNAAPARSEVRNGTGISIELAEALFGIDD